MFISNEKLENKINHLKEQINHLKKHIDNLYQEGIHNHVKLIEQLFSRIERTDRYIEQVIQNKHLIEQTIEAIKNNQTKIDKIQANILSQGAKIEDMSEQINNHYYGSVGSVGNQGEQVNVAGEVIGNQIKTQYNSPQEQNLAEAAAEIQKLLKQLEKTNPTATVEQQEAYIDAAMPKTLKERLISALSAMGDAAIEEFLQRPGVKVVASGVKAWLLP